MAACLDEPVAIVAAGPRGIARRQAARADERFMFHRRPPAAVQSVAGA
ncbi:hypothetical protein [Burkholderia sp. 22313]